jgi:hypothetical protein
MNKKYFSLLLAVMFLLAAVGTTALAKTPQTPVGNAIAKILEVQKTNETLKAFNNGETALTQDQRAAIKEQYLSYLDAAFEEIKKPENEFYLNYLLNNSGLLPQRVSETVKNIVDIAKLDISTDEKLELLASDSICSDLVSVATACLALGLYFLFAVGALNVIGLAPNLVLISLVLANINFIIALIAVVLYPIFCIF